MSFSFIIAFWKSRKDQIFATLFTLLLTASVLLGLVNVVFYAQVMGLICIWVFYVTTTQLIAACWNQFVNSYKDQNVSLALGCSVLSFICTTALFVAVHKSSLELNDSFFAFIYLAILLLFVIFCLVVELVLACILVLVNVWFKQGNQSIQLVSNLVFLSLGVMVAVVLLTLLWLPIGLLESAALATPKPDPIFIAEILPAVVTIVGQVSEAVTVVQETLSTTVPESISSPDTSTSGGLINNTQSHVNNVQCNDPERALDAVKTAAENSLDPGCTIFKAFLRKSFCRKP